MNARVKDALYHFVISWPEGEVPDRDEAFASAEHTLHALGFDDHQFVAAIHRDTANVHVHVMVNRVNPTSYRATMPAFDHYTMDRSMRELEIRFGRSHANGPYVVQTRNGVKVVVRADESNGPKPRPPKRPAKAELMEEFAGDESLFTYVRGEPRKAVVQLLKATDLTWQGLHQGLARYGLELKEKGRGLAVHVVGTDTTPVKASDMHENLSLARLVKRLGLFEPPKLNTSSAPVVNAADIYTPHTPLPPIEKLTPVSKRDPIKREERKAERAKARQELKVRYQTYRGAHVTRKLSGQDVAAQHATLAATFKARRDVIKKAGGKAAMKRPLYSLIALDAAKARLALQQTIAMQRYALKQDPTNQRLDYRAWCAAEAQKGDEAAIAQVRAWAYADRRSQKTQEELEAERAQAGMTGAAPNEPVATFVFMQLAAHDVRRNGSVVYWHKNQRSFIDHGRFVRMGSDKDRSEDHILTALMFSRQKFGPSFTLTGQGDFVAQAIELIAKHGLDIKLRDSAQQAALDKLGTAPQMSWPRPK